MDEEGNEINYYILKTTYYEADPAEITGLNTEAIKRIVNPDRADSCQKWLDDLADWLARDSDDLPLAGKPFDTARWRLTPAGILDALKAGMSFDPPEPFFAVERLLQPALADTSLRAALLTHATRSIAAALAAEKSRRAEIGFDDMIRGLAQALAPDSPNRERLAQALRQAYPVALIDEFQDTDPAQYAIFRTLYADAGPEARLGLLMIGDPKQAIYAFRGADIFTYLAARHDTRPEQRYTLDTNWRSTMAMVGVVNRLADRGVRVPDDVSIVGYDDTPLAGMVMRGPGPNLQRRARGSEKVSGLPDPDHVDHVPIRIMPSSQLGGPSANSTPVQAPISTGPR